MKLIPILTEKSLGLAKIGRYSFWAPTGANKNEIRKAIEEAFGVHVTGIRTINYRKTSGRNLRGKTVTTAARKKAMVTLNKNEKIDAFEVKKEKNK